jgi:amino acid transporter
MSTANQVPETWGLTGDDARQTLERTGRWRLIRDAFMRLRYADGFSHARSLAYLTTLIFFEGIIALIGFTIALPNDFSKIASSATPLVDIVNLWLGQGLATVFLVLVIFSILALDVVGLAATGRLVFAMARDNILPASTFLRQVNPGTRTPIRALVTASLLGLVFTIYGYYISVSGNGKDAFFALVGATSTLPFIVYLLTVLAYVLRRDRMASLPEAFNLGAWAKPVMYAALVWTLIALGLLMIPKIFWLTDAIVVVVIAIAAAWYFLVLRGRLARGEAGVDQLPKEARTTAV